MFDDCNLPWIVVGDFNTVQNIEERNGGNIPNYYDMKDFNNAILEAGLEDAGYSGKAFTWANSRLSERIDRAFINSNWVSIFEVTSVRHLERICSDHAPILVDIKRNRMIGKPRFRFQNMWSKHKDFCKWLIQKAAIWWWKEGDFNTKFFHNTVKKRRKKLYVDHIMKEDGTWITAHEDLVETCVNYFAGLLHSEGCNFSDHDFSFIPKLVNDMDNNMLMSPPSMDEVKVAIFNIHKDSAPGPDGFGSGFFQSCWEIVKEDLHKAAVDFFAGSHLDKAYTSSLFVLIPKSNDITNWKDFRPISLTNVKMNFLSKMLVNRLRNILPNIITQNQTGFVPGRGIVDNILLAQELIHTINSGN
ncbi:hypothetical protein AXF42_Ash006955 [Apostasia shenzhenica]|uniref:Endonuclease/exonuclease/phosphatase domain-containing protein n=1 Tax=Apostasia shenzhenica TaxID=1088818 RepID=A0A2I0BEQ4_9ASPA|nr:hypothetical protein AXF42_Ash006955 [Apostasia shenzhenica]